ncbi:MAG: glycosyltransferase family 2 protein [Bacilli bacterium]|nr:glycosyltransferase family 2 protein [Bacilli bacterium]
MLKCQKLIPKQLKNFLKEHKYIFKIHDYKKYLNYLLIQNKKQFLTINDEKNWINKFNKAICSNPEYINVARDFMTADISVIKNEKVYDNDIIAICVQKNDLIKLEKFISHHRKLGIDKFIILDNDSNDGSIEYLLKQKDVILLQTKTTYTSSRRVGWINRIIAHYGYNRWYFIADSDELLVYNECENKSIKNVIAYCEKKNIIRARALMVDMYANKDYYANGKIKDYYKNCIYFDADSYIENKSSLFYNISGGPRKRLFNISPCLTKYPLVYFKKKDIYIKSHFLYPYKNNINTECNLILKHYKFLPGELNKYKEIANKGNYYNGSAEYKRYVDFYENNSIIDFIYYGTKKYNNSNSLNLIKKYNKIDWDN